MPSAFAWSAKPDINRWNATAADEAQNTKLIIINAFARERLCVRARRRRCAEDPPPFFTTECHRTGSHRARWKRPLLRIPNSKTSSCWYWGRRIIISSHIFMRVCIMGALCCWDVGILKDEGGWPGPNARDATALDPSTFFFSQNKFFSCAVGFLFLRLSPGAYLQSLLE